MSDTITDMFGRPVDDKGVVVYDAAEKDKWAKSWEGIEGLYRSVGVEPPPPVDAPKHSYETRHLSDPEHWPDHAPVDRVRIASTALQQKGIAHTEAEVARLCAVQHRGRQTFAPVADVQEEIGWPGTKISRGRIGVEFNDRLLPVKVRGSYGTPGIYEELPRVDPGIHKHVSETTSLACSATYEPPVPEGADRWTRAIVERCHSAILNMGRGRGFRKWLRHAATINRFGFAPFELVWAREEPDELFPQGLVRPWDAPYREVSSVYEWVFDDKMTTLLGGIFQARTDRGRSDQYTLTTGDTFETARLLLVNLGAVGLNVEGISPLRPTVGLRRLKELLLQLYGLGWQKHGVPIPVIMIDLLDASIAEVAKIGSAEHKGQIQTAINRLQKMRARLPPVIELPPGAKLSYVSPQKELPDLRPMLEYLDFEMALAFSNEGALLGTQTGSYALAASKENAFLSGAAAYAEAIAEALDQWMSICLTINHPEPDSIEVWPTYTWRFRGTQDSSRWATDLSNLLKSGILTAPEPVREAAASVMGLPQDAFEAEEGEEMPSEEPEIGPDEDDSTEEEPPSEEPEEAEEPENSGPSA